LLKSLPVLLLERVKLKKKLEQQIEDSFDYLN
jgi:hypothetical protein